MTGIFLNILLIFCHLSPQIEEAQKRYSELLQNESDAAEEAKNEGGSKDSAETQTNSTYPRGSDRNGKKRPESGEEKRAGSEKEAEEGGDKSSSPSTSEQNVVRGEKKEAAAVYRPKKLKNRA